MQASNQVNTESVLLIAGVDEAGRGCLAGAVYAAAVILGDVRIDGLDDSKKLKAAARERLFERIQAEALACAIARAEVEEVDRLNILQASLLAMQRAVAALPLAPHEAWVDGNQPPKLTCRVKTIIDGDALHAEIMAASILAKVARDREMLALDVQYPGYGLAQHKGYGTALHMRALRELGPSPIHRRSFAPVRQLEIWGFGIGDSGLKRTDSVLHESPIPNPESPAS